MDNTKSSSNNTIISQQNSPNEDSASTSKQQKDMSLEEQSKYYKDLFIKSKKLIMKYEEKIKNIEEANTNLKNKLKEYEAGKFLTFFLIFTEDGKTCEFLFKFKYENTTFYFFKSEKSYVHKNILIYKTSQFFFSIS